MAKSTSTHQQPIDFDEIEQDAQVKEEAQSEKEKTRLNKDEAWEAVFEAFDVVNIIKSKGVFAVSSDDLKEYHEPRLMAKFDSKATRPAVFKKYGLSILSPQRGYYLVGPFELYEPMGEPAGKVKYVNQLPEKTLAPSWINNEATALNYAYASGILEDFLDIGELKPTLAGRMGSGAFRFKVQVGNLQGLSPEEKLEDVPSHAEVNVTNAQMEIDACYEGERGIAVFEAKSNISEDFMIRQLYYPYRRILEGLPPDSKPVHTVFLVYTNGTYTLFLYRFADKDDYNSIELVKTAVYRVRQAIGLKDIEFTFKSVKSVEEPEEPFPQADRFTRIVNLMEVIDRKGFISQDEVAELNIFVSRQVAYYTAAGRYLGIFEKEDREVSGKKESGYVLTEKGKRFMCLDLRDRQLELIKAILEHKPFYDTMSYRLRHGFMPSDVQIVEYMQEAKVYNVTKESTFKRRARTVSSWIQWVMDLVEPDISE